MNNLTIRSINAEAAGDIGSCARDALKLAKQNNCTVSFMFNGVSLTVCEWMTVKVIEETYFFLFGKWNADQMERYGVKK